MILKAYDENDGEIKTTGSCQLHVPKSKKEVYGDACKEGMHILSIEGNGITKVILSFKTKMPNRNMNYFFLGSIYSLWKRLLQVVQCKYMQYFRQIHNDDVCHNDDVYFLFSFVVGIQMGFHSKDTTRSGHNYGWRQFSKQSLRTS